MKSKLTLSHSRIWNWTTVAAGDLRSYECSCLVAIHHMNSGLHPIFAGNIVDSTKERGNGEGVLLGQSK